ncbi:MAG: hypothetical protein HQ519_00150 [Planctomycetes bacterium]|nr:hypothetical protein [Planctomycetota bacterium]
MEELVRVRYPLDKGFVTEIEVQTGHGCSRIDVLAVGVYNSTQGTQAFECKVSRSDIVSELDSPEKNDFWRETANRFWYVCAPGIVDPGEIPEGCGLLVAQRHREGSRLVRKKMAKNFKERKLPEAIWRRMLLRGDTVVDSYRQRVRKYAEIEGKSISFNALQTYIEDRSRAKVEEERGHRKSMERFRRRCDGLALVERWGGVIEALGGFFDRDVPPNRHEIRELLRAPQNAALEAERRDLSELLRMLAKRVDDGVKLI